MSNVRSYMNAYSESTSFKDSKDKPFIMALNAKDTENNQLFWEAVEPFFTPIGYEWLILLSSTESSSEIRENLCHVLLSKLINFEELVNYRQRSGRGGTAAMVPSEGCFTTTGVSHCTSELTTDRHSEDKKDSRDEWTDMDPEFTYCLEICRDILVELSKHASLEHLVQVDVAAAPLNECCKILKNTEHESFAVDAAAVTVVKDTFGIRIEAAIEKWREQWEECKGELDIYLKRLHAIIMPNLETELFWRAHQTNLCAATMRIIEVLLQRHAFFLLVDSIEEILARNNETKDYLVTFDDCIGLRAAWIHESVLWSLLSLRQYTAKSRYSVMCVTSKDSNVTYRSKSPLMGLSNTMHTMDNPCLNPSSNNNFTENKYRSASSDSSFVDSTSHLPFTYQKGAICHYCRKSLPLMLTCTSKAHHNSLPSSLCRRKGTPLLWCTTVSSNNLPLSEQFSLLNSLGCASSDASPMPLQSFKNSKGHLLTTDQQQSVSHTSVAASNAAALQTANSNIRGDTYVPSDASDNCDVHLMGGISTYLPQAITPFLCERFNSYLPVDKIQSLPYIEEEVQRSYQKDKPLIASLSSNSLCSKDNLEESALHSNFVSLDKMSHVGLGVPSMAQGTLPTFTRSGGETPLCSILTAVSGNYENSCISVGGSTAIAKGAADTIDITAASANNAAAANAIGITAAATANTIGTFPPSVNIAITDKSLTHPEYSNRCFTGLAKDATFLCDQDLKSLESKGCMGSIQKSALIRQSPKDKENNGSISSDTLGTAKATDPTKEAKTNLHVPLPYNTQTFFANTSPQKFCEPYALNEHKAFGSPLDASSLCKEIPSFAKHPAESVMLESTMCTEPHFYPLCNRFYCIECLSLWIASTWKPKTASERESGEFCGEFLAKCLCDRCTRRSNMDCLWKYYLELGGAKEFFPYVVKAPGNEIEWKDFLEMKESYLSYFVTPKLRKNTSASSSAMQKIFKSIRKRRYPSTRNNQKKNGTVGSVENIDTAKTGSAVSLESSYGGSQVEQVSPNCTNENYLKSRAALQTQAAHNSFDDFFFNGNLPNTVHSQRIVPPCKEIVFNAAASAHTSSSLYEEVVPYVCVQPHRLSDSNCNINFVSNVTMSGEVSSNWFPDVVGVTFGSHHNAAVNAQKAFSVSRVDNEKQEPREDLQHREDVGTRDKTVNILPAKRKRGRPRKVKEEQSYTEPVSLQADMLLSSPFLDSFETLLNVHKLVVEASTALSEETISQQRSPMSHVLETDLKALQQKRELLVSLKHLLKVHRASGYDMWKRVKALCAASDAWIAGEHLPKKTKRDTLRRHPFLLPVEKRSVRTTTSVLDTNLVLDFEVDEMLRSCYNNCLLRFNANNARFEELLHRARSNFFSVE